MDNIYMNNNTNNNNMNDKKSLAYRALCILEELNDTLHEGVLENDTHLKEIVYQCQRIIDITE
jgi:hypothetical protein